MRCVAAGGLLALVGCNQIFGISATRERDAGVDVVPAMPGATLTWQVATVTTSGTPDPVLAYPPLAAPRIRIAPIDVALDDSHDTASYAPDGVIAIPGAYVHNMWRLEYILADGVPHELQWSPDDLTGHVAVPLVGRLARGGVPAGSGYIATPSNPPASYARPRVFTTGLWTEGLVQPAPAPGAIAIDYDFASAISLSGPRGRPDPVAGDLGFVVDIDLTVESGCAVATGSAMLASAALEPGVHSAQTVVWDAARPSVADVPINVTAPTSRLATALGAREGGAGFAETLMFGIGPSALMPGLTATPDSRLLSGPALLPVPAMLTLLRCDAYDRAPPPTAQPLMLKDFPHLLHVQITNTRTVDSGLRLTSGVETVALSAAMPDDVRFPAAIPIDVTLATPTQGTVDLGGPVDHIAVGAAGGVFTLRFAAEAPGEATPADLRADYFDVIVHRIDAGGLTTERIYTVTAPVVRIDGGVLAPQSEYVLEVRSFKGHPKAARGDFTVVDYPYGAAIIYTRTFKTS
jgi:hypothetical protein